MPHSTLTAHGETAAMALRRAGPGNGRTHHMATRLLMLRDVTAMTALSRSAVYALMAESRFSKPIRRRLPRLSFRRSSHGFCQASGGL